MTLTLVYSENGELHSQELNTYASVDALLPVRVEENQGEMGYNMSGEGRLYLAHRSVTLANGVSVENGSFYLVKNGAVALEAPAEAGEAPGNYSGYSLEMMGGLPCTSGDRVELHFTCTDQYGIDYDFALQTWKIVSDWKAEERWPEADTTVITWPK